MRLIHGALGLVFLGVQLTGFAQSDYPNKPIHMVVAWAPASGIDIVMRKLAEPLKEELGQTIVIENKAGAAGALGSAFVANAPADGYTLLFNSAAMNMLAAMGTSTAYKMPESFTPILNVFSSPMVLVAYPGLDVKTPQDLVALAVSKKGDLFYASSGYGAPSHFVAELFRARTGIKATLVPMKSSPEAMMEQISGRVAFHFAVASTALAILLVGGWVRGAGRAAAAARPGSWQQLFARLPRPSAAPVARMQPPWTRRWCTWCWTFLGAPTSPATWTSPPSASAPMTPSLSSIFSSPWSTPAA